MAAISLSNCLDVTARDAVMATGVLVSDAKSF